MKINEVSQNINTHIHTLNTKGLTKLGQSLTSTKQKIGFIIAQIFAVISIFGIIPAFILINRHFKKVALQTIQKDNTVLLTTILNKTFSKAEIEKLQAQKLFQSNKYLDEKQMEAIKLFLTSESPENKAIDPNDEKAEDTIDADLNNIDANTADEEIKSTNKEEIKSSEKNENKSCNSTKSDESGTEDFIEEHKEEEKNVDNTNDSPNLSNVKEPSDDEEIKPISSEEENEEKVQVKTKQLHEVSQTKLSNAEQLLEKLNKSINPQEKPSDDYKANLATIAEKAAERMQEKNWTFEETVLRIVLTFTKRMETNNDNDHERAIRHLKEALDPTVATQVLGWFTETKEEARNKQTLAWLDAPIEDNN